MEKIKGIFVGGTNTGVGKTVFSILLMTHLQSRDMIVAPMKPAETGCRPTPVDSLALLAAANRIYPVEKVCPYRLAMPAAPEAAAAEEGMKIEFGVIKDAFDSLARESDFVIVEGAGAMATPYARGLTGIELARKLGIPVILITPEKLGTVGQSIASVKALKYSKTRCLGVVLSHTSTDLEEPHCRTNAALIESHLGKVPFLGTLPRLKIPGDAVEKLPITVIPSWARENIEVFEKAIAPALDKAMSRM